MPRGKKSQPAEPKWLKEARKVLETAHPRSQQYKEAKATVMEAEEAVNQKNESESEMEVEESGEESEQSDEEEGDDEEEDDEESEEEEEALPRSSKRQAVAVSKTKQGGKKKGAASKVKKTALKAKGKKTTKKAGAKKASAKRGSLKPMRKDYAPPEKPDEYNEIIYEASVGGGVYVRLSRWLKNEKLYIQIRKSAASGCNMPVEHFGALKQAIDDINVNFADNFEELNKSI